MALQDGLAARLQAILGSRLSLAEADRDHHAQSESFHRAPPPDAVAWPESAEEVAAVVSACAAAGVPVVPWGTGTSLEGHALALRGGVTLDLSRMNRVIEVRAEDMQVTVQPGLTREALNAPR